MQIRRELSDSCLCSPENLSKRSALREKLIKILTFFLELSEIMATFAPTESATLPVEQRTRAGLLFIYVMNIYTKQPLSIDDQIAKLKLLGLIIADEDKWHCIIIIPV